MSPPMSVDEYKQQLGTLCTRGGVREWPRKTEDQHVLLKSATYSLEAEREYSEKELNEHLAVWCKQVGQNFIVDYASLRRWLVDAGYLKRDAAGTGYTLDEEQGLRMFEREVGSVDPVAVVDSAQREIEERKRKFMKKA